MLERWHLLVGGGWVRIEGHLNLRASRQVIPPGHIAFIRFSSTVDNPDRLMPLAVLVHRRDGRPVTSTAWARVKLGTIEQQANAPAVADAIRMAAHTRGPLEIPPLDSAEWPDDGWVETVSESPQIDATLPLEKKGTREFFEAVAELYRALVAVTKAPAQPIADANRVPITTVYYWIRQAREIGVLASAPSKGKAG